MPLTKITTLFFDVGGVLLTNGWDGVSRRAASDKFKLDRRGFEKRHVLANPAFERGEMTLDEYLERTIFYKERPFSPQEFKNFMYSQSQALPESLEFARELARTKSFLIAAMNNESAEMNAYRIERFALRDIFTAFFSSCYVGIQKPDAKIYDMGLFVLQRSPEESVFVDDRAENIEGAQKAGMTAILFQNTTQLVADLKRLGVQADAS
jgi:putative hydrolase of the HAD superfamily